MANKIMHAGLEFAGGGSGGGTTVIANPETASTDDLDTVQIGETVYNVHGNVITLTQAAYDLLPSTEKMDPTKVFYITDSVSTDTVIVPNPESSATDELTKLQIDSTVYSLAGGSEVEANPIDPATDTLSKIDIDGTIYGVDVSNNDYFGAFIDTNNVIQTSTQVTSQATYTASEDCAVVVIYSATSSTQSTISINSVIVLAIGGVTTTLRNVLYMKRGDVLTFTPAGTYNSYEVYGLKSGSESNFFQPVIYSTAEREIGVWTDNKPLYQKNIEFSSPITIGTGWTRTGYYIDDVDSIALAEARYMKTTIRSMVQIDIYDNDGELCMAIPTGTTSVDSVIVQYTKTTDTPGSGSHTSSGSPAIHYSTSEQIMGTWIDGSTLYQTTVNCGLLPNDTSWHYTAHGISNIDKIVDVRGIAIDSNSYESIPIPNYRPSSETGTCLVTNSDGYITYMNDWLNADEFTLYVTLQYTKATS